MYMISGGVYTDTSFTKLVDGADEVYGPFETRAEAIAVWRGRMGVMIDVCEHRLFIDPIAGAAELARPDIVPIDLWVPIEMCPLNEQLLLGYYGEDDTWYGHFWRGRLFQWECMDAPLATGAPGRLTPTHFMRIGVPA